MALEASRHQPSTQEMLLHELAALLPPASEMETSEDADRQARAALRMLIDMALSDTGARLEMIAANPGSCPNCGTELLGSRSPYCSEKCREDAAFVRQFRKGLLEGTSRDEERQAALGQKLWHLLGGGYPRRQRLVTDSQRTRLFLKRGGVCEICGAPAATFDHLGSG